MFYNIDDFVHPLDKKCADKVMNSAIVRGILDIAFKNNLDEVFQYVYSASHIRLPDDDSIMGYVKEGCKLFDVQRIPQVYIIRSYNYDVECIGFDDPVILIPDVLIEDADEAIMCGRVMSAVASIKAEHHKFNFLEWIVDNFSSLIPIPYSNYIIQAGMSEWMRAQQYSIDRAFYLSTNDYELSQKNILFGRVPMEILANFKFGEQGTYDIQVEEFYNKTRLTEKVGAVVSMCQRERWVPEQYKEFELFYNKCGGVL